MDVRTAVVGFPAATPISTMARANSKARSFVFIKAPSPYFTSKTIASAPPASFLLITELAIRGILSTVPVASRRAYKSLSAGANSPDCPMTAKPMRLT